MYTLQGLWTQARQSRCLMGGAESELLDPVTVDRAVGARGSPREKRLCRGALCGALVP
jgi:hypothetical protein